MPDTYSTTTWVNGTAPPINQTNLNHIETGIDTIDSRTSALEKGVAGVVGVTFASSITIDASVGMLYRITATGNFTLAGITNGVDGQTISVEVLASGAARTISFGFSSIAAVTVGSGTWWSADFRYHADIASWLLADTSGGSAGGGIVSGYIPSGSTTANVVHALGTNDLLVGVHDEGTGLYPQVAAVSIDVNTVQFTAANAFGANQYRYTIAAKSTVLAAPQVRDLPTTQAFSVSLTVNAAAGNNRIITATGDFTLNAPSNGADGQLLRIRVIASGAQRVVTFAGTLKRPAAMASTLTIGAGLRGDVALYFESAYGWSVQAAQVV